jgi:mono/diheme cytochrome c family protein
LPRARRRLILLRAGWAIGAVATLAACTRTRPLPARADLSLRLRGHDVPALSLAALRTLGETRVTVNDPHEHRLLVLIGVPATAVLDRALGAAWRDAEEVVATCADGFHPAIPVRQLLEREAFVAYARADGEDFAVEEAPAKRTPVGPYYVVWKAHAGEDPPEPMWPYQVVALEATDFATRFAGAIPSAAASADARVAKGFERFRTFCLPCHTINGCGGGVGPELNYPASVTEYFSEPVLRAWIADPQQVRWNARMPPPLPPTDDRPMTIDAVVAYLKAMAADKRAPPSR